MACLWEFQYVNEHKGVAQFKKSILKNSKYVIAIDNVKKK